MSYFHSLQLAADPIERRIRDNTYEFPSDRKIGTAVKTLIQQILTPDPSLRPTLFEILDHLFFTQGPVPSHIPSSAHDVTPDFSSITSSMSESNLRRLRRHALLDQSPHAVPSSGGPIPQNSSGNNKTYMNSIQQQEKEFQKAIQPGSPISALLSSARQPLVMGVQTGSEAIAPGPHHRESALLRKLQATKESPLRRNYINAADDLVEEERKARKELEAQKARIVAQMAPVPEEPEEGEEVNEEDEPNLVTPAEKYAHLTERLAVSSAPSPEPASAFTRRPLPQIPFQKDRHALVSSRTRENLPTSSAFRASTTSLPKSITNDLKGKDKEHVTVVHGEKENVPTTSGL